MDFSTILLNTLSHDATARTNAEQMLAQHEAQNLGMFLTTLTAELVDENKNPQARTVAGVILKNRLSSQNEAKRQQFHADWLALDPAIRENIKNGILHTLGSPVVFARAAVVCSSIAQIELPKNFWPQLMDILLQNTKSPNEHLRKGTLLALGYICEEINPAIVSEKSNLILLAIVQSLREEETVFEVKHAAAKALESALEFAKDNFAKQEDRDYIMSMVCGAVCSSNVEVKVAGYECLVKIASLYYSYLPPYMQSLFNLTLESIKKEKESVALQAIEFWATICDEEIYIMDEIEDASQQGTAPSVQCHNFIKGALQYLVPLVLETLTKQDEDADEDQWDIAKAGASCLTLIANCAGNDILNHVIPFVTGNINNTDWHLREAATMAFGSILEGTSDITQMIVQAIPVLLNHLQTDSKPLVKDTAAWTIGRVCQLHPLALRGDTINYVMGPLLAALRDTPRVAANVCWALNNIAESFRDEEVKPATDFKPYFENSVLGLLGAAEREDSDENNLKASAYEAINEFIQSADSADCTSVIDALVPVFLGRLDKTFQAQVLSQDDRDAVAETQGLLCGLLQTCTSKLEANISKYADACAALYFKVFNTKNATVHEEALMAFGALANALEGQFEKYMPHFHQFLLLGLRTYEEYQVCTIAVGVVGDICRALQKQVTPYCDEIVTILIHHLQDPRLNKSVKPPILSCFGDIALAICGEFSKYLNVVMTILLQAARYQVDKSNDEMVDYQNELREGILEALTGIIQGLRTDNQAEQFMPYVEGVVQFITEVIFKDSSRSDAVTRGAIGVLGDLAHSLQVKVKPFLSNDVVRNIVNQCVRSDIDSTVEVASWAQEVILKL